MTHTATAEERLALAEERLEELGCCGGDCHLDNDEGVGVDPVDRVDRALESAVIDAINGLARIARSGGQNAITAAEALLRYSYSDSSPFG